MIRLRAYGCIRRSGRRHIAYSPNAVSDWNPWDGWIFLAVRANEPLDQRITAKTVISDGHRPAQLPNERMARPITKCTAPIGYELVRLFSTENCRFFQTVGQRETDGQVAFEFADGTNAAADITGADALRPRQLSVHTGPVFRRSRCMARPDPGANRLARTRLRAVISTIGAGWNLVTYPVRGTDLVNMVALTRSDNWAEES
jgi:salicylate hydroxylase